MLELVPASTPALPLKDADEQQLRQWTSAFGTPQQVALRSRIVLAAAEGISDNAIAQQLEVNRKTVTLWRARFEEEGLDGLWEVAPDGAANRLMARKRSRPLWMPRCVPSPKG